MAKKQEIEVLRIMGAFGIVWFHSLNWGREIAYSGLIVFLIISMYFAVKSKRDNLIVKRMERLLIPWAFWGVIYGVLNIMQQRPFLITGNGIVAGLLTGTSIHLWYIPFVFISIAFFSVLRKFLPEKVLVYGSFSLMCIVFITTQFWRPWSLQAGIPWAQHIHSLPGVLFGVFIGLRKDYKKRNTALLIILVSFIIVLFSRSFPEVSVTYLIGIALTSIAILPEWNFPSVVRVDWISECTYGIYLVHIGWLMFIKRFDITMEIMLPVLVFILSLITVLIIKKITPAISEKIT